MCSCDWLRSADRRRLNGKSKGGKNRVTPAFSDGAIFRVSRLER
jgi:hypothetical protein